MIKEKFIKDYIEGSIKKYWDFNAYTDLGQATYKYSDVAARILLMHKLFNNLNIKKGDKIALIGKNSSAWTMTYLSIVTYGAVVVPILADFHPREIHNIVNHSESVLLLASNAIWKGLDFEQMEGLKAAYTIDPLESAASRDIAAEDVLKQAKESFDKQYGESLKPEDINFEDIPNSELVEISYTSGSTGMSKGVMLPANSLAANINFATRHMELNEGESMVSILPLAHSFGCAFEFLWPFSRGVHVHFISRKPTPTVLLSAYKDVRPHLILSVPLVFEKIYKNKVLPVISANPTKLMLKVPGLQQMIYKKIRDGLVEALGGRFREVVLGGAPLNYEVEEFFRKIKFPYTVGYGMTECGPLISYENWDKTKFRSCGRLVDTLEAKIDWHDKENKIGEIWVRGENLMYGYYKNQEATKEVIDQDGWLHTGDLGYIDDENFIFLKGRAKSLLLGPSGENIFPDEIEALYMNKPFVEEVLVVMRDHLLVALIYPDKNLMEEQGITEEQLPQIFEQIRKEVNEMLPRFKQVAKIEIRKEEFEKTPKRNIKRFLYS